MEAETRKHLETSGADAIAIIVKDITDPRISEIVERLYFLCPQVMIIPEFMGLDVINADVYHMMYENLFVFDIRKGLSSQINRITKRLLDFVLAVIGIIITSPITLLTAIAIALFDGFPIVYTQERYGKDGKSFKFRKFRSMYNDSETILQKYLDAHPKKKEEWKLYQKLKGGDPRLIRYLGNFIRRTSIDELPQLLNVLTGEMSIVGPRPYMPRERKLIGKYFYRILSVKPGITGLWQATGRNDFTFDQRLKMDTWYIQNWSMWLDFIVVFKTLKKALT